MYQRSRDLKQLLVQNMGLHRYCYRNNRPFNYKKSGHYIYQIDKQERRAYRKYHTLKDIKTFCKHIAIVRKILSDPNLDKQLNIPLIVSININIAKLNSKHNTKIEYINNIISNEWIT